MDETGDQNTIWGQREKTRALENSIVAQIQSNENLCFISIS